MNITNDLAFLRERIRIGASIENDYIALEQMLAELAKYCRTFVKIEHRIVERIERDILGRIGLSGDWQTMREGTRLGICETWRSIIREELERKDGQ